MSRGSTDYGVPDYSFFAVETPLSDVIAERLGFSRLDNRGRVLWIDDFRNGLYRWRLGTDNGGANPEHVLEQGKLFGYYGSIKLDSVGQNGISEMFSYIIGPVSKRLGVEVGIYLPTNYASFDVAVTHNYDVDNSYSMQFSITPATGEVNIHTPGGLYTFFTPSAIGVFTDRWISIKLVSDFSTGEYVRAMIGNTQYDFTGKNLSISGVGLTGASIIDMFTNTADAVNVEPVYVGYFVVSGDEP